MKIKYLFIALSFLLLSCSQAKQQDEIHIEETSPIDYSDYVHIKHRDSLSADELELLNKLEKVIYSYLIVEDNVFSFKLSKENFLSEGIPEKYYDLLMKNIEDNNNFSADEQNVKLNMDSLWQVTVEEYKSKQLEP